MELHIVVWTPLSRQVNFNDGKEKDVLALHSAVYGNVWDVFLQDLRSKEED